MGGLISGCLGSCCGAAACAGISACCSCNFYLSLPASRAVYTMAIFVATGAALAAKYWGRSISANANESCRYCGDAGVMRIFFGMACLHFLLAVATIGDTRFAAYMHTGFWFAKVVLLTGLLVGGAFLPLRGLLVFGEMCRWVAMLFLLFQVVALIDLAYSWNESWRSRDDELAGEWRWRGSILAVAFALYSVSLAGIALMFEYLAADGCALNTALLACTLVAAVGFTALSVSPVAEHGAILASAVVTAYVVYIAYSALASAPDVGCNTLIGFSTEIYHSLLRPPF
mmetsp:Transcript_29729/g.68172  ORF Transcript_29729/g.68172 Transcript_29729/m.68172 type:complete len:286 (-) Transcript_29729:59-916(-)